MSKVVVISVNYLRLREIADSFGKGVITEWLRKEPAARARFRVRMSYLSRIPRMELNTKQFRYLEDGLSEIKWEADKKTWRAIGFDKDNYFVMVMGCSHKGAVYEPRNWLQTAKQRKKETIEGKWRIIDYVQA
jgi:phage-related protein